MINLIGGHNDGPHGTKAIQGFAQEPLFMPFLQIAGRDVIDDGIAKHMIHGLLFADRAACFTNDHSKLSLIVDLLGSLLVCGDGGVGTDDGVDRLGKHNRKVRAMLTRSGAAIKARLAKLPRMSMIVFAYTNDIAGQALQRRNKLKLIDGQALTLGGQLALELVKVTDQLGQITRKGWNELLNEPGLLSLNEDRLIFALMVNGCKLQCGLLNYTSWFK